MSSKTMAIQGLLYDHTIGRRSVTGAKRLIGYCKALGLDTDETRIILERFSYLSNAGQVHADDYKKPLKDYITEGK